MTIYHYCGTDAFISIMKEKVLWLSSIRRMNDRLEGKIVEEAIAAHFSEESGGVPFGGGFGGSLGGNYDLASRLLFACSFSARSDQAVQWMSYAHRGQGFSIGFDENILWEKRTERQVLCDQEYFGLTGGALDGVSELIYSPVVYCKIDVKKAIMAQINIFAANARRCSAPARNGAAAEMFVRRFRGLMKDPSFAHEEERRLIYRAADSSFSRPPDTHLSITDPVQWRPSAYGIVPYFKFRFDPKAVTEVWIGPANIDALQKDTSFVMAFLQANEFSHVKISISESAYRG